MSVPANALGVPLKSKGAVTVMPMPASKVLWNRSTWPANTTLFGIYFAAYTRDNNIAGIHRLTHGHFSGKLLINYSLLLK
jgi:hypothetical protein